MEADGTIELPKRASTKGLQNTTDGKKSKVAVDGDVETQNIVQQHGFTCTADLGHYCKRVDTDITS
eukprot:10855825-Ditylum_brightwellii.AAC.1